MREFRTKKGRCAIDDNTLKLESSIINYYKHIKDGNPLLFWGTVLALGVGVVNLAVVFAFSDTQLVLTGVAIGGVGGVVSIAGWRAVNRLRGFTSDDEIRVDSIKRVETFEGTDGLRRPRFVVEYEDGGEEKKRYIRMPSRLLSFGEDEFEKAKGTFEEVGVLDETPT